MVMVSSRRGHDEVSVTKRLGKGGDGLSTKPQLFPTALENAQGLVYLGFTTRIEPGEQLIDVRLTTTPMRSAMNSNILIKHHITIIY